MATFDQSLSLVDVRKLANLSSTGTSGRNQREASSPSGPGIELRALGAS